jgi:hypothetical protein
MCVLPASLCPFPSGLTMILQSFSLDIIFTHRSMASSLSACLSPARPLPPALSPPPTTFLPLPPSPYLLPPSTSISISPALSLLPSLPLPPPLSLPLPPYTSLPPSTSLHWSRLWRSRSSWVRRGWSACRASWRPSVTQGSKRILLLIWHSCILLMETFSEAKK